MVDDSFYVFEVEDLHEGFVRPLLRDELDDELALQRVDVVAVALDLDDGVVDDEVWSVGYGPYDLAPVLHPWQQLPGLPLVLEVETLLDKPRREAGFKFAAVGLPLVCCGGRVADFLVLHFLRFDS